jgi:hypothetical protein
MATIHTLQSFFAGDDWSLAIELTDQSGNPVDPSTASAITWKLDDETGTTNYITLTLGSGVSIGSIPSWSVPVVGVVVPKAQTAALVPGTFRDQLQIVLGGLTSTYWQGPIQALQTF